MHAICVSVRVVVFSITCALDTDAKAFVECFIVDCVKARLKYNHTDTDFAHEHGHMLPIHFPRWLSTATVFAKFVYCGIGMAATVCERALARKPRALSASFGPQTVCLWLLSRMIFGWRKACHTKVHIRTRTIY